jgi:amidase
LVDRGKPISVYEYWQLNKRKVAFQQAYNNKWNAIKGPSGRQVDIVIMPTLPHVAVPHRTCRWMGYTKVWNLLDYTALSFPAGTVQKDLDAIPANDYRPRNDYDSWNWSLYDPENMDGHPIGLQIVGRRFDEEKVLGAASAIEKLLK